MRIVSGAVPLSPVDPRAFTTDELRDGWRLACRAAATEDLVVEVPPLQTRPKAALAGVGRHVILRPSLQKRHLVLEEPTMEDQRSDLQRVLDALEDLEPTASLGLLRELGGVLRTAGFDVTAVVCDRELIALEPADTSARRHAIAFDLGTTTVVATLLDLETGTPVAVRSMLNRQQPYGADVITRISATMMDAGALAALSARAHETLAQLVGGERARVDGAQPDRALLHAHAALLARAVPAAGRVDGDRVPARGVEDRRPARHAHLDLVGHEAQPDAPGGVGRCGAVGVRGRRDRCDAARGLRAHGPACACAASRCWRARCAAIHFVPQGSWPSSRSAARTASTQTAAVLMIALVRPAAIASAGTPRSARGAGATRTTRSTRRGTC